MDKNKLHSLLISTDTSIKEAMKKLSETGGKILFVVDKQGRLLGTITDGDIRRGIINGIQLDTIVQKIMITKYVSVSANCSDLQNEAKELLQLHRIERVPVVDGKGSIVDVISWLDYLDGESKAHQPSTLQNPVVIMAGGRGTRLDPFTRILPKPLIPLGDKPIVEHIMDGFYKNGFSKFILIVNYKKEMIMRYFGENNLPYEVEYVEEGDYRGTAGGLVLLRNKLKDTFTVTNCDTILEGNYIDFFNWHKERDNIMTVVGSHKELTVPYGVLSMNNGSFIGIDEKPKFDLFINTGTYIVEPRVLELINENEYIDMHKLIDKVKTTYAGKISVCPHWGGWFDMGQWDEYRKSLKLLEDKIDDL